MGIARAEILTSFKKNQGDKFTTDQFRLNRAIGGGGVLFDMGIHAIDVLRYILDDDIKEVGAFSQNLFIDCNGEDTLSAVLKFKNGAQGVIATSGALPYAKNGVEIYGDKGAITTDGSVWISVRSADFDAPRIPSRFPRARSSEVPGIPIRHRASVCSSTSGESACLASSTASALRTGARRGIEEL